MGHDGTQCKEIDTCLNKNNTKKAYQLVKDLTSENHSIQNKSGKFITEEQEIFNRWAEYCSELYNYERYGDYTVLDRTQHAETDLLPVLCEEVEIAVAVLKNGRPTKLIIYQQTLFKQAGRPYVMYR
ncbi:MAG: hypothetical protein AB2705_19895 [Candidatus Thiodiazotropha sp.]